MKQTTTNMRTGSSQYNRCFHFFHKLYTGCTPKAHTYTNPHIYRCVNQLCMLSGWSTGV